MDAISIRGHCTMEVELENIMEDTTAQQHR